MKIAILVPHLFIGDEFLSKVIFSPGRLVRYLLAGLVELGHQVTLYAPISVNTPARLVLADDSFLRAELDRRGYNLLELLKKHPLTCITLARQLQSELVSTCYQHANRGDHDLVHVYCNEEELAMVMAQYCQSATLFNHHEPFNFLLKYRSVFPKYQHLPWVSFSKSQQQTLSSRANFVVNIPHGIPDHEYVFSATSQDYVVYLGRIIEPKGVHYAIQAAINTGIKLKIAGKHYSQTGKDDYWQRMVKPYLDHPLIEYLGYIHRIEHKQQLLAGATALIMPSTWSEPFGVVMIEALACGTPIIGFNQGSIPEVVEDQRTGFVVAFDESDRVENLSRAIGQLSQINRHHCRQSFEQRFTSQQMVKRYHQTYLQQLESHRSSAGSK